MDPQLLQRLKNCKTLPAVPALPLQVLQICRDERADCKKVADLISKDPSFVAKLLNVANSGFYGGARHKVTTVTQAVTLLGMNSIATLAFCFSLYRDLRKKGDMGFDHSRFWHRSILSSVAGRVLGKWANVASLEEIFLAALLQDLGMLVLSETLAGEYCELYNQAGVDHVRLEELEKERLETDHSEVGAWLAETWELPEVMQLAVRGSHDPERATVSEDIRSMVFCVALSGRLADLWCNPDTEKTAQDLVAASQKYFDMTPQDLMTLISEVTQSIPEYSTFFQIDLGSQEDLQKVVTAVEQTILNTVS